MISIAVYTQDQVDAFWNKVNKNGPYSPDLGGRCWIWVGARLTKETGYHSVTFFGTRRAHIIAYKLVKGNFENGKMLYQACRNRICVNPDHMELKAGMKELKEITQKTHCKHGHRFDKHNTYMFQGRRYCRACRRDSYLRTKRA